MRSTSAAGPATILLILVLLLPSSGVAQPEVARDKAQEVRDGGFVHLYMEYEGSVRADRSGADGGAQLTEWRSHTTSWNGSTTLYPEPGAGRHLGGVQGEVAIDAQRGRRWIAEGGPDEEWKVDEEELCRIRTVIPAAVRVEARAQPDGLLLRLTGATAGAHNEEDACKWTLERTDRDGTRSDAGDRGWGLSVPIVHAIDMDHTFDLSFVVPYDGRVAHRVEYASPIPYDDGVPAAFYCAMDGSPWAAGTCAAKGTLTVRTLVDPCPAILRTYPDHHDALATYPPPPAGANEALVRAWSVGLAERTAQVNSDHRFFQLMGCAGTLEPDPWAALLRAHMLKRDALMHVLRQGELSPEGKAELITAQRQIEIMGADDGNGPTLGELSATAASAEGALEIGVHSPVSLRAWDEAGRHAGPPDGKGAAATPIPGATYEGEPGGAQRLSLPAGLYRIEIDEHAAGRYLLDVKGAGTEEFHFAQGQEGRTTTLHFGVVAGWEGERLEAGPLVRAGGDGSGAAASPPAMPGGSPSTDEAEGDRGTPIGGVGAALILLLALAVLTRRRG